MVAVEAHLPFDRRVTGKFIQAVAVFLIDPPDHHIRGYDGGVQQVPLAVKGGGRAPVVVFIKSGGGFLVHDVEGEASLTHDD